MTLHLITDRRRLAPAAGTEAALACLVRQAEYAVAAGIDVIQVRERDLEARPLLRLVRDLLAIARGTATKIVVNDRVDIALAAGADGVHLPARGLPTAAVRALTPARFIVGRSVHNEAELEAARGADYAIAGTVWPTGSKADPTHELIGAHGLARLIARAPMPLLAIGGVEQRRFAEVASLGASGVAAIGLFLAAADAQLACRATDLREIVNAARRIDSPTRRS